MKIINFQGNRMYAPDSYIENLKTKRIVIDEWQNVEVSKLSKGVVVDLGANIGHMTLIMARTADKVYAFEPEPDNFRILKANVELNKLDNVILYNYAVSNFEGEIDLHLCDFNNGMHRVYPSKYCKVGKIKVNTLILDNVIKEKVDHIKIDIEGAEYPALLGMKNILTTYHPSIMIEFHPPSIEECGDNAEEVYNFIRECGYNKFRLLSEKGDVPIWNYFELDKITRYNVAQNLVCEV